MTGIQQVRRPLVGVAVSVGGGLFFQHAWDLSPLLLLSLTAFVLAFMAWTASRGSSIAVYLACMLVAASYGAVEQIHTAKQSVLSMAEVESPVQEIFGVVDGDPVWTDHKDRVQFLFQVKAVRMGKTWWTADHQIQVAMRKSPPPIFYGESWRFCGRYRSSDRVIGGREGYFSAEADAQRIRKAPCSFKGIGYASCRKAADVFEQGMADFPEYSQLIQSLILGYRSVVSPALTRTFSLTGTLHIFAISGTHVVVMASILIAVLKFIGISKPRWGWFLIPALFFYVVATGMMASAARAFLMASIYFVAPLFRRKPDSASAIALSALILLCINPLQLYDPGFILSFTVVIGLVMVHACTIQWLKGFRRPAWMVPFLHEGRFKVVGLSGQYVGMLLLTSVTAWVFSAPQTAYFFNTVSPSGIFGNMVVVPLSFVVMVAGCCTLLASGVSDSAVLIFNHANQIFTQWLTQFIHWVVDFPAAYAFVPAPSVGQMLVWYAGLSLFFTGPRRARIPSVALLLGMTAVWIGGVASPAREGCGWREKEVSLAFQLPDDEWVLAVDAAPYNLSRTMSRLRKESINHLYAFVLNGADVNVEMIGELYKMFPATQVWVNPAVQNSEWIAELKRAGADIRFAERAQWAVGGGVISISTD